MNDTEQEIFCRYLEQIGEMAEVHASFDDVEWDQRAYALALLRAKQGFATQHDQDQLELDFAMMRREYVKRLAELNAESAAEAKERGT